MKEKKKWFQLDFSFNKGQAVSVSSSCGCGSTSGGCNSHTAAEMPEPVASSCGCGSTSGGCGSHNQMPKSKYSITADEFDAAVEDTMVGETKKDGFQQVFDVKMDRRTAFRKLTASLLIGAGAVQSSCSVIAGEETKEKAQLDWEEQFKGNYKLMNKDEKQATVDRLVRSYQLRKKKNIKMSATDAFE